MQIASLAKQLEALGLSEKEARVYVAALFLGPASVQKIAEQAGVNRTTVYFLLEDLIRRGLMSETREGKRTLFAAEDPDTLYRLIHEQKQTLASQEEHLARILPELEATKRVATQEAPVVRFYRGIQGIRTIRAESVKKSKPHTVIYGFTNVEEVLKMVSENIRVSPKLRLQKRIASKVLYWSKTQELPSDPKLLRKTKKVAEPPKADMSLYEDRAVFLTYRGKEAIGIVIESREIVGALRQLFEIAWKNLPENPSVGSS